MTQGKVSDTNNRNPQIAEGEPMPTGLLSGGDGFLTNVLPCFVSDIVLNGHAAAPRYIVGDCEIRNGDALELMPRIESGSIDLIITSPPYNMGKEYEPRKTLNEYLDFMSAALTESYRLLNTQGTLCLQVGNYVSKGVVEPLDALLLPVLKQIGFNLRNRVVWTFGHGLHCSKRYSGRYETVLWLTKSDHFVFNLDSVRVPQKYPAKRHYKGPKKGLPSCNPLGKNPGDVWEIPNVKHNHPEKTAHPCQFPEALIERLVLAHSDPDQMVLDPFAGSGTVGAVCNRLGRRSIMVEIEKRYVERALFRIQDGPKNKMLNQRQSAVSSGEAF